MVTSELHLHELLLIIVIWFMFNRVESCASDHAHLGTTMLMFAHFNWRIPFFIINHFDQLMCILICQGRPALNAILRRLGVITVAVVGRDGARSQRPINLEHPKVFTQSLLHLLL